jgi:hypothetical protein
MGVVCLVGPGVEVERCEVKEGGSAAFLQAESARQKTIRLINKRVVLLSMDTSFSINKGLV